MFKHTQCLFRFQHLFSIVHLFRVERHVPALVFTSSIAWLYVSMFINVYELHALTDKSISASMQEDNKCDEYTVAKRDWILEN